MDAIIDGHVNDEGEFTYLDMDQLLDAISYETSKQSMTFSIRFLIKKGLVEKQPSELRRKRVRVPFSPTKYALGVLRTKPEPMVFEDVENDLIVFS